MREALSLVLYARALFRLERTAPRRGADRCAAALPGPWQTETA